jgi:hypothetical protein
VEGQRFSKPGLACVAVRENAQTATPQEVKRQSGKVTRLLRLLRAHGLITKMPHTHRYRMSVAGRSKVAAILAARQADTKRLLQAA